MDKTLINNLVSISPAYHTEVNIKRDFDDVDKLTAYIPNEASRQAITNIIPGLAPGSTKRVHLITGAYGTGKSHFGLMLTGLLRQIPEAKTVLTKISQKDSGLTKIVERHLEASEKFLIVLIEPTYYATGFNQSLLVGLQKALDREDITFEPKSQFRAAWEKIDDWQDQGLDKDGQTQKADNPYLKLTQALRKYDIDPFILKDRLKQYDLEAYGIFEDVHKKVTYGSPFVPHANADPGELYQETISHLQQTGQWEGIWVVCDEFGSYLAEIAQNPTNRDSLAIQNFAEYCKGSGDRQCHFFIIAHQTLADYATGYRSQEEWEKIAGRFIGGEYSLRTIGDTNEIVELMATIINTQPKSSSDQTTWDSIKSHSDTSLLLDGLEIAKIYTNQSPAWKQDTLIQGCFPLHPMTTYCLPILAEKIGQRHRTLFTFFNDTTEGSLRHFIETQSIIQPNRRLNLYPVDYLITYFGEVANRERIPASKRIIEAKQEALGLVGSNKLARRLINLLAIFEIVEARYLEPTENNLINALHLSNSQKTEIQTLLQTLTTPEQKIIRKRANGFYELRKRSGEFDWQSVINKTKNQLRPQFIPLSYLKEQEVYETKFDPIVAETYQDNHFIKREAVRELTTVDYLANPKEFLDQIEGWYDPARKKYKGDVLILYILGEDKNQLDTALINALDKSCQHPQLVIAIPKQGVPFQEILLNMVATEEVKVTLHSQLNQYPADLEELEDYLTELGRTLSQQLDKLLQVDNLIWICDGNRTDTLQESNLETYISTLLEKQFAKTPLVRDEVAEILRGRDSQKSHRKTVMKILLEDENPILIPNSGGRADKRIFRNCLIETGLLIKREDQGKQATYDIAPTLAENAPLAQLWGVFEAELKQEFVKLDKFIRKLLAPPYGLSHQLVEILLATFFRHRLDECVIYYMPSKTQRTASKRVNLNAETIMAIVSKPDSYILMYYEIHPQEKEYVSRIITLVNTKKDNVGKTGIWEQGYETLLYWFSQLPPITISASTYEDEYSLALVKLLKDTTQQDNSEPNKAKNFFRTQLPGVFNINLPEPSRITSEVETILERFEKSYAHLENYAESQALNLIGRLAQLFNSQGVTRNDLSQAVQDWYNRLTESQRIHVFTEDAGFLKKAIEAEGKIDERFLADLPEKLGLGTYTTWTESSQSALFLLKVEMAKTEIETWQPTLRESTQGVEYQIEDETDEFSPQNRAKLAIQSLLQKLPTEIQIAILEELLTELTK